jgi:N-acetylmuramic acid 6-phosphate (MurNAc-6-P) etherase
MLAMAKGTSGRLSFEQTRTRVELFIRGRNEVIGLISGDDHANRTAATLADHRANYHCDIGQEA